MQRTLFDTNWECMEGAAYLFPAVPNYHPVTIPHDAVINAERKPDAPSGSSTGYTPGAVLTYRNIFEAPLTWKNRTVRFEFEGVYMNAEVYVNGDLVSLHPYGYTSFFADATSSLRLGEKNELKVVCNTKAEPNSRWYTGAGIYRHVWLLVGNPIHMRPWGLKIVTPDANTICSTVEIEAEIENETAAAANGSLKLEIFDKDVKVAEKSILNVEAQPGITKIRDSLKIEGAKLWEEGNPNLYNMVATFEVGEQSDSIESLFGVRTIKWNAVNGLMVNGKTVKLKGGCIHHDNGPLGSAAFDRAEERKVEILMSAGYNAIRCAHNPPSPALLDICDRKGVYVIDEAFDCWRRGKSAFDYHLHFEQWWRKDIESMIRRDFNHPSVIIWSYGNEIVERDGNSDGYEWSKRLSDAIHSMDSSRPTNTAVCQLISAITTPKDEKADSTDYNAEALIGFAVDPHNDPWGDLTEDFFAPADIGGYNYMEKRYLYDLKRFPDRIFMGTETFPHEIYDYWKSTMQSPRIIGDFVWTAFDYLGEAGIGKVLLDKPASFGSEYPWFHAFCGDFDICGFKRPQSYFKDLLWGVREKPFIAVYRPELYGKSFGMTAWSWEPVTDSWTFPGDEGKPIWVDVYCKDDEVELVLNGKSFGKKVAGDSVKNKVRFDLTYEPGELVAIAYKDGGEVSRESLHTLGSPDRLLLTADRSAISKDGNDLSFVTVEVCDANGERLHYAENEISFTIEGSAELIAVGSGNPTTTELFGGTNRKAYEGRMLAIVRSKGQEGRSILKAQCAGLKSGECIIDIE